MESLPSSSQRAAALGKGSLAFLGPRFPMPSALTTDFTFQPVFYKPKNPQPREDSAYEVTLGAQSLLEEACHLLSLLGLNSAPQMFWVQPKDWLMAGGMAAAWSSYGPEFFGVEAEAPAQEIEALAGDYFSIEASKRSKVLRIPLDRLSRAGRERDLADRAIDLGIALESLLLHDTGSTSELRFRLSYRGAWLLGNDAETRLEVQQSLVKLYDLRSQAVHAGFIKEPPEAAATLKRAAEICRALIHRVIVLKCDVEWAKLVLGG
jgi:hypothetical protein